MALSELPPISSLSSAPAEEITAVLDVLFEPTPELHAIAIPAIQTRPVPANPGLSADLQPPSSAVQASVPSPPFTSYSSLISHVGSLVFQLADAATPGSQQQQQLHGILGSHPRLGAQKKPEHLSEQSKAEQAQLNKGGEEEAEQLRNLNQEYEDKFPGLRYVVFVNGRSRPVIMENMRARIDRGDIKAEEKEAIQAMVDIAKDRARKMGAE